MRDAHYLTTTEAARILGVAVWQVRRAGDTLGAMPRAGLYRLIPRVQLGSLRREMVRRGWLPAEEGADAR